MTLHHKTRVIVFKKENRLEADKIFSVFTQDFGRLEITGKAIRKINSKLRGSMEIFSFSEIEFINGKNRKILTDALAIKKYKQITYNPEKFSVACQISHKIDQFINGQEKDEKIFGLLGKTLDILESIPEKLHGRFLNNFFWNFIFLLGYSPQLQACVSCHQKLNPYGLYFSCQNGGTVCKVCSKPEDNRITSDALKILRLMAIGEWQLLARIKVESRAENLVMEISNHYQNHLLSILSKLKQ